MQNPISPATPLANPTNTSPPQKTNKPATSPANPTNTSPPQKNIATSPANPTNTSNPATPPANLTNTSPPQNTNNTATSQSSILSPLLPIVQIPQINPLPKEIIPPDTISQLDSKDCREPSPGDSNQIEMQQCVVSRMATFPNSPPSSPNLAYTAYAEGMDCDDSGLSGTPPTTATNSKISPKSVRKKKGSKKRRGGL
ncbi:hypothetical protein OIU79_020374 [Salix purpurea]|uniref:Uncharacterized protein n=1 Tax=Salix purpurea TaxID=77065 RepID=A0A9Q0WPR5_SALPP|nr:hypothetical protein OIU79_020374 [Salix purpurea]